MNLADRKLKTIYFVETIFIYLLSCIVVYVTLLFLAKINLFELSNKSTYVWRLNPYLALPYLVAILLGMVVTPLGWENIMKKIPLKELGFTIPCNFLRESFYGTVFFILFIVYNYVFLSKGNNLLMFSAYNIVYMSIAWFFVAFGEELLYRGMIQRRLTASFGKYGGLVFASVLFAFVGHPKTPLFDNLILRLPFGLILGYLYLRSQSLLIPIGMHWGINILFAT